MGSEINHMLHQEEWAAISQAKGGSKPVLDTIGKMVSGPKYRPKGASTNIMKATRGPR